MNAAEDGPDKARINFILFKLFESAATTSASLTIPGYASTYTTRTFKSQTLTRSPWSLAGYDYHRYYKNLVL